MNQPVTPAMTATIVPASSALTMKGYAKSWWRSVSGFQESPWNTAASGMTVAVHERGFRLSDHDEPAVGGVQDLDRCAVEAAERLARDHLFGRALDRATAGQIDDAVEVADDRIDVVRDEQHGDPLVFADATHEGGDRGLVGQVEAVERLVEQQEIRSADERLRDQEPLLLAAGELADRLPRISSSADELDHLGDTGCVSLATWAAREWNTPAGSVQSELNHVDAADPGAGVEAVSLRQVADPAPQVAGRPTQPRRRSDGQRQQPEDRLDQRRLTGTVRPEDRDEVGLGDAYRDIAPDHPAAEAHRGAVERDRRFLPDAALRFQRSRHGAHRPVARASAAASACNCRDCQSWKLPVAGTSVSVIVVTGIPRLRAASVSRLTSGVLFWLLKNQTLICPPEIWRSTVVLSAAVGSVPSLIALRNVGGVKSLSPSACASGAKMLSEAPTGTPWYLRLIVAISCLYRASPFVSKRLFCCAK